MSERDSRLEPGPPPTGEDDRSALGVGRRISSTTLFQGHEEIIILHRAREYRLRITKADKLILTK